MASTVKLELDTVRRRDGLVTKGTVTALFNVWRGAGEGSENEVTSIQRALRRVILRPGQCQEVPEKGPARA